MAPELKGGMRMDLRSIEEREHVTGAQDAPNSGKQVIVTRHQGTVTFLQQHGYVSGEVKVIEHATERDVRGADVFGVLPMHLAVLAASVTVVDLAVPFELRGTNLDAEAVAQYCVGVTRYRVHAIEEVQPGPTGRGHSDEQ